jgi:uncharacterized protein YdeI (YjbR/CyaY-like superfamily)
MRTKRGEPIPDDLAAALAADAVLVVKWDKLRPSCQQRYVEHICEAKWPETRQRRVIAVLRMMTDWYERNHGAAKKTADGSRA